LARVEGGEAILNLGSSQGVIAGTQFEVLEDKEPIQYKGKTLGSAPRPVALLEVARVEPDLAYLKVVKQDRPVKKDDKVQEKIEEGAK
ncbi:MAG TPA: FlgT C-terminal domain-containing protein, partial [Thermodesulfobacteriota bacterium]|nr:FlgT C-terminal domain-containing protein [Thermodesulfobacteriota bacterium]